MQDYPYDNEVMALLGRIITTWSEIHDHIHREIGSMQTRIYVYQKRAWCQTHGPETWPYFVSDRRVIPDNRFKLRLRYFRLLARALAGDDEKKLKQIQTATDKLIPLYDIRNDLAQSVIRTGAHWKPKQIRLESHEWREKWSFSEQESRNLLRGKVYTVSELEKFYLQMNQCLMDIHAVYPDRLDIVPELPTPPS